MRKGQLNTGRKSSRRKSSVVELCSSLQLNLNTEEEESKLIVSAASPSPGDSPRHSKTSNDSWVCPSDRQLALRAKLQSGWSVKTANYNNWKQPDPLTSHEHEYILSVIEKADALEKSEQMRVGRLVDRLEGMKRCCLGNGENDCILCGEVFRFYHRSQRRCAACHKMTCGKCGVETNVICSQGQLQQPSIQTSTKDYFLTWLCKVCYESKEMWKKSGAWFYKGMPKYILPEPGKGYRYDRRYSHYASLVSQRLSSPLDTGDSSYDLQDSLHSDEDSDDVHEDQLMMRHSLTSDDYPPSHLFPRRSSLASEDSSKSLPIPYNPVENVIPRNCTPPPPSSLTTRGLTSRSMQVGRVGLRSSFPRSLRGSSRPRGASLRCSRGPRCFGPTIGLPNKYSLGTYEVDNDRSCQAQKEKKNDECDKEGKDAVTKQSKEIQVEKVEKNEAKYKYEDDEDDKSEKVEEDKNSHGNEYNEFESSIYNKAKPLGDKDNKLTSRLRRLSLIQRKIKGKSKGNDGLWSENISNIIYSSTASSTSSSPSAAAAAALLSSANLLLIRQETRESNGTLESLKSPECFYGTLELQLVSDELTSYLNMNIIKAKNLKGIDSNGLCDSYCKLSLLSSTGQVVNVQVTKTVYKTNNPHYNTLIEFHNISSDILTSGLVQITILDNDRYGDQLLAETFLHLSNIHQYYQKKFQISLEKPNYTGSCGGLLMKFAGQIEISLAFYQKSGTLKIGILRCCDLVSKQDDPLNPVVHTQLVPGSKHPHYKTNIKWRTSNPEYNEQFVYLTSLPELSKTNLMITLWNTCREKKESYIGGLILGSATKGNRLKHWNDMIQFPNQNHTFNHYLSANNIE